MGLVFILSRFVACRRHQLHLRELWYPDSGICGIFFCCLYIFLLLHQCDYVCQVSCMWWKTIWQIQLLSTLWRKVEGKTMTPRKAQHLSAMLLVLGMLTMLCAYVWEPLFFVGAVIAVSSLIPHFLFNRCPHCGKLLEKVSESTASSVERISRNLERTELLWKWQELCVKSHYPCFRRFQTIK